MPSTKTIVLLFVVALFYPVITGAQNGEDFILSADKLAGEKAFELDKLGWKYHAGDDPRWAAADFDDSGWKNLTNDEINANPSEALEGWDGRAWFRLRLRVDEQLVNRPLSFRMWHWGASEVYVDGELIQSYGTITPDGDVEFNPRGLFFPVVFKQGGTHTIAVRYSFKAARDLKSGTGLWLVRGRYLPGFLLRVEKIEGAPLRLENRLREARLFYIFIGLFLSLALVHFLLYVFYRRALSNLFYSFFVTGLALTFLFQGFANAEHFSATLAYVNDTVRLSVQSLAVISLLAFLYIEFAGRVSRFFWVLLGLWLAQLVVDALQVWREAQFTLVMLTVTLADCVRIMVLALLRRREGAWIIAAGVVTLAVGVGLNVAIERDLIDVPAWAYNLNLYFTVLSVPLAVSIYLARNFARTNRHLEEQLAQVQELSARQLEHERTEAELRLAHERTRAENERRARELEEARQLQLSMLPARVPQLPNLEIAAYMKPATEVGGDYYDFHIGDDGTLTVAVGDATGHGLKAGTMVTATKSLFNNLADEPDITTIFRQTSRALKQMNLRGLFMAMTMLKIKSNNLQISSAGMPAALIYRAQTKLVEEISIKALPLGSIANFPYRQQEISLSAGDTVVMLSDGFPEMFNEAGETLGFDKAGVILMEAAEHPPQEIINRLIRVGESWAGNHPQDDDVTFVVLKVKAEEDGKSNGS
ncbi:MAG: SpoIIE family protein phosphatase [Pyrinomonadaceae bacterium]|nr:SpoIIE family protein phosphatase [Pyrinomonadaceae bacterium]